MPTVFDRLLAPVIPILEQIESMRPKHGNETLAWFDWVRTLVYFFTRRCGSRNAWAVALANADPTLHLPALPRMTLSDGMRRFPPTLLRHALRELLTSRDLLTHPELALLGQAYAVDGSEFPLINGMTLPKSNELLQRVKLHLKFGLNQMVAVDFYSASKKPANVRHCGDSYRKAPPTCLIAAIWPSPCYETSSTPRRLS